ncbi:MAG: homocysteine S-methyltransferase family protein [Candidatus Ranarchaeia archaeon]
MSSEFFSILKKRPILLDGGTGALLMEKGLPPEINPNEWNIINPEVISELYRKYFAAGSDAVLTNTFGASRIKLQSHKLEDKIQQINQRAVELAKEERVEGKFIIGDIGPSGKLFEPLDKTTYKEGTESFAEQAKILDQAGIDLFLIETQINLKEALIALKAVKEVSNKPVLVSMTFEKKPRGYFTIMGDTPKACVEQLIDAGADAVGTNCSMGSSEMIDVVKEIVQYSSVPVLAKPNAGLPEMVNGKTGYNQKPEDFVKDIKEMIDSGVKIVGGCCGTTPTFIQLLYQKIVGK